MRNRAFLAAVLLTTLLYWIIMVFRIPVFQGLPEWFWSFTDTPARGLWLFPLVLIVSYLCLEAVLKKPMHYRRNLILLVALGFLIQLSFGFMEGRGVRALSERLVDRGHAEFVRMAAKEPDFVKVATHYEALAEQGELGLYPRAKPPGALLFYMLMQKASSLFFSETSELERRQGLVTFATFLFPLLTYWVLFPLNAFCRLFWDDKKALLVCALYLFFPNVILINYHLDQSLYPGLFMLSLYLITAAYQKKQPALALLAGASTYLALFVTFSLLPIVFFAVGIGIALYATAPREKRLVAPYVKAAALFVVGLLIMGVIFRMALGYEIWTRYQNALAFHQQWKGWAATPKRIAYFGVLSNLEFALWTGVGAALIFWNGAVQALIELIKRRMTFSGLFTLSVAGILLLLGFFSKTKNETGRLWMFLVPLVSAAVVDIVLTRFREKPDRIIKFVILLQLVTALVIKFSQDS